MTGHIARRLSKLERTLLSRTRFVCVLDTPENHALVDEGFIPEGSFPAAPEPRISGDKAAAPLRRLGSRDLVIFMSALEMAA
jgi:hypothetical protein